MCIKKNLSFHIASGNTAYIHRHCVCIAFVTVTKISYVTVEGENIRQKAVQSSLRAEIQTIGFFSKKKKK